MTLTEYMNTARTLKHRIIRKRREAENLRISESTPSSPQFSDMPKNASPNTSKMQDTILRAMALDQEANEAFAELEKLKMNIMTVLNQVKNPDDRDLLYKRYIEFKPWKQVAAEIGYSESHTKKLHGWAVKKLDTS